MNIEWDKSKTEGICWDLADGKITLDEFFTKFTEITGIEEHPNKEELTGMVGLQSKLKEVKL